MNIPHSTNKFNALQFHIHTFSEHQILGQGELGYYPAELHVVHQEETAESFAVFGTMISVGADDHSMFEWFLQGWEAVAQEIEDECVTGTSSLDDTKTVVENFECSGIGSRTIFNGTTPAFPAGGPNVYGLPTNPDFGVFTYKGGLTTPPCTEIVNWNLLDAPMEISESQLERLKSLILCYVSQSKDEDGSLKSCGHGTVASNTGSTSRPPQPLLGRQVIHRCPGGPDVTIADIGVTAEDARVPGADFVKPDRKSEPLNIEESDCSGALFKGCSDDPRYNTEHSPNLKYNADAWYDAEGYWVGTMTAYDANGQPSTPVFASQQVKNTFPYDRSSMMVFMNRTVVETRYIERKYVVMPAADPDFCNLPIPEDATNVLGSGVCGVNGFVAIDERFGTATFEKDGTAQIFLTNGLFSDDKITGRTSPIGDSTIFSVVTSDEFEHTYTESFGNAERTKLVGSGQTLLFTDFPPYSLNPLAETFAYSFNQVDEAEFKSLLEQAYEDMNIPTGDRIPFATGDCVFWFDSDCPNEASFRVHDPVYQESPYQDDPDVSGGMIALFVILGIVAIVGVFYVAHVQVIKRQAARYQNSFSERIAKTVTISGAISPEALAEEFRKADLDGDGKLDKEEMRAFMGEKMDSRDFEAMFAAADLDRNGRVDYAEFCAFVAHANITSKDLKTGDDSGSQNDEDEKVFHT